MDKDKRKGFQNKRVICCKSIDHHVLNRITYGTMINKITIYTKHVCIYIYIYIRVKSLLSSGRGDNLAYLYSMLCISIHTLETVLYLLTRQRPEALRHYIE